MNYNGIIIGLGSFLIIGLFHPVVIKGEYYFGKRIWPLFLAGGIIFCAASVMVSHQVFSALLGLTGFTMFWSIHELFEQENRVKKGWYPENPDREKSREEEQAF